MERNILVDKLKGYACFLVLFGHVIMGVRLAGINIPSFFRGVELFVWSFHVALFLFLSGVVYKETGEWKSKKTRIGFVLHKLLNLGVPYVVFSVVYILINSLVGEANTNSSAMDVFNIWKTPVAQYWYLYSLFFLFAIWAFFSKILKNWQIFVLVIAMGYLLPMLGVGVGSFETVLYAALPFGVGTLISFSLITRLPFVYRCLTVLLHLIVSVIFIVFGKIEEPFFEEIMMLFGIYSSIMFISLIQNIKFISRFLLFINKYSLQIYLLHTIFTAGVRIVLIKVDITQWWIHVVVGTLCGLLFSVIAAIIAKKTKFLDFCFFPSKTYKILKNKNKS